MNICSSSVNPADCPAAAEFPQPFPPTRLDWTRQEAEVNRLVEALRRHNNNRTSTAMELGISRVTLYKKLHRYGLI